MAIAGLVQVSNANSECPLFKVIDLILSITAILTDQTLRLLSWQCPCGEIGRRDRFKICCLNGRAGSSPARGTKSFYHKY